MTQRSLQVRERVLGREGEEKVRTARINWFFFYYPCLFFLLATLRFLHGEVRQGKAEFRSVRQSEVHPTLSLRLLLCKFQ